MPHIELIAARNHPLYERIRETYRLEANAILMLAQQADLTVVNGPWGYGKTSSLIPMVKEALEAQGHEVAAGTYVGGYTITWEFSYLQEQAGITSSTDTMIFDEGSGPLMSGRTADYVRFFHERNCRLLVFSTFTGFYDFTAQEKNAAEEWLRVFREVTGKPGNALILPDRKTFERALAHDFLEQAWSIPEEVIEYILSSVPATPRILRKFDQVTTITQAQEVIWQYRMDWFSLGYITFAEYERL